MTVRRKEQNQILYIYGIFKELSIFYTKKREEGTQVVRGRMEVILSAHLCGYCITNPASLGWVQQKKSSN